jgi:tetratricopeptide (TPR) repeat protein
MRRYGFLVLLAASWFAAPDEAKAQPTPALPTENWATKRARELTELGGAALRAGQVDSAVARFNEAIAADGSYGPAYLALAKLRESTGEFDEALSVLKLGMERILGFWDGLFAQAELFARARRFDEATKLLCEFRIANPDHEPGLEKLLEVAAAADRLPVALGAARKLLTLARARGDAEAAKRAASKVRALMTLVAGADPVIAGGSRGEAVRRALARFRPR